MSRQKVQTGLLSVCLYICIYLVCISVYIWSVYLYVIQQEEEDELSKNPDWLSRLVCRNATQSPSLVKTEKYTRGPAAHQIAEYTLPNLILYLVHSI